MNLINELNVLIKKADLNNLTEIRKFVSKIYGENKCIVYKDKNGKPYSNKAYISISDSNDLSLYVCSQTLSCAIDVEKKREFDFDKLIENLFSEKEKEVLNSIVITSDKIDIFFKLWTRKECIIKMQGVGLKKSLLNIDTLNSFIIYRGNKYYFYTILYNDYIISLCTNEMINSLNIYVDLEQLKY